MSRLVRTLAASSGALALLLPSAATAATGDSTPTVVDRETVQADLTSTGALDVARLFSQLTVIGKGTLHLADPISGKGLRNLDGFDTPTVKDGKALWTVHVDGTANRRTVSDFTKKLPVTVKADYTFNGKPVKPSDIVGKTGDLSVVYTITNVTATPTQVSWTDGRGVARSETIDLVTPLVGQLSTTLPSSFSNLSTPRADLAGDGRGSTILTWTMVLFEPIGQVVQTFGWTGHVTHAQIPSVNVQIVPVPPARKPELKFGQDGFQQGALQASELTAGAGLIDTNLLKLQAGASQLLAGLTQLSAGAVELRNGLTSQIGPGAAQLATGAKAAKAGSGALSSGLGALATGAGKLSSGTDAAKAGSADLAGGLAQISAGLDELNGVNGLPAAKAGAQALRAGVDALLAGLGSAATPGTILNGLARLSGGAAAVKGGLDALASPSTGLPAAKGGVDQIKAGLDAALTGGGPLDQLIAAAQGAYALSGCPAAPPGVPVAGVLPPSLLPPGTACFLISSLAYGLGLPAGVDPSNLAGGIKAQTSAASGGLGQVSTGLGTAVAGVTQLQAGMVAIQGGLTQVTAGLHQVVLGLRSGNPAAPGLAEGLDALVAGLTTAVTGVSQLATGASAASAGSTALDSGLGQLATGAGQVAAGANQAASGAGQLDTGLGKITDGAGQLSAGIDRAGAGSSKLANGLSQARDGDAKVVAGTGQLHTQGTSALVSGGNDTASTNAERYARMVALDQKAQDGALPYGAPEGATGSAAYQLTLAAATSATQDNTVRALTALLLLVAASAVSWIIKRRFTA